MLRKQALRCLLRAAWRPQGFVVRSLATATPPSPNDAFANGTNAYYVEEMYRHWRQDPRSVHVSWDTYFTGMDKGLPSQEAFSPPPSFLPQPLGGAPTLDAGQGAKLDDHLKVNFHSLSTASACSTALGSTPCSCLPSTWPSCRGPRPARHT